MVDYPNPDTWEHASSLQKRRAARSFAELRKRNLPVYKGPLFIEDEEKTELQSPQDVAKRVLVLWAVELRAEGIPQSEAFGLIDQQDLWESVSPIEKKFLQNNNPDEEECQKLIWRLESIWVLLWALGYLEELGWPCEMCDVPKIVEILKPQESNKGFVTNAILKRKKTEILDAADLTMRIHWAIRDAYLNHGGIIPEDLDWSGDYNAVHVNMSEAVGVVEQRHYSLNWLINFMNPETWDDVDTPT